MKKATKLLSLAICLLLALCLLTACGGGGTPADDWNPTGADVTFIKTSDAVSYFCIYANGDDTALAAATSFREALSERSLPCALRISPSSDSYDSEILFGETDRIASKTAASFLEEKSSGNGQSHAWVFYYRDGKLAIVANSAEAYEIATARFFETYFSGDAITFKDTLKEYGSMTDEDYEEYKAEEERKAAEKLKAERDALLEDLLPLYEDQSEEIQSGKLLGTATANIGTPKWVAPTSSPINEHPRLFITKDNIEQMREALKEPTATNERFRSILESESSTDGKCGPVQKDFRNRNGLHNYDNRILELIQIKALGYLIEGHELFGYQAIYYMKNFLLTLDIQYIASDQCREYGNVMMTAACVYDWCYDLLTEEDKAQLIAGVETRTAAGECGDPSYTSNSTYKKKMEVGFPPSGQGAIQGHGAEGQILRNYLAAAIAFYGDNNSWWDYIAARVYAVYVPVRNYYYQSGISQQGTGLYIGARHTADIFSAWLLTVATGKNPYQGIDQTVRNFLGYECAPNALFTDGDGSYETKPYTVVLHMSYMTAYLFGDEEMLAWAEDIRGNDAFGAETNYLTSALYVALRGLSDIEPAENRYEGMSLIQYNGHPVGQYIIREAWNSSDSAAAFMRIKELSTNNHEHEDAGTFEIYYKGMLTSDGGLYATYGSVHTSMYHQATISHNGLIIFDPMKWNYKSTEKTTKWYSGGQIKPSVPGGLEAWLEDADSVTGTVTGRQHGYSDEAETKPLYAYIAGDITRAYPAETVDYVGRRMLAVYTGDEEYPMVFFVYDDITSDKTNYEKRFLLQISSKEEPTIDDDTVITDNGDGRLVLTCLSKDKLIRTAGGRNTGNYQSNLSMNYCINGYQCLSSPDQNIDDKHWGRVEIVHDKSTKDATFMNVIYVTDRGNDDIAKIKKISNSNNAEGGVFENKIVAVFVSDRTRRSEEFSFNVAGSKSMSYYVSGVAEGNWKVTVDGKDCGTYAATEDGGLLTFTAPEGTVVISPVK